MPEELSISDIREAIVQDLPGTIAAYQRSNVPARVIRELAEDCSDSSVALFLASYPEIPSRILTQLAGDFTDAKVMKAIAVHARTPKPVLLDYAKGASADVREQVASNRSLSPQVANVLAGDAVWKVRLALALNPVTPARIQADLSNDPTPFVRAALLQLPRLENDVLKRLSEDQDLLVRARAVLTTKVEPSQLLAWADSDDLFNQLMLMQRRNLPDTVMESLCFSQHLSVQSEAISQRELSVDELLGWAETGDGMIRCLIAARRQVHADIQQILANDPEQRIRKTLAANPDLDEGVALAMAIRADDAEVWQELAQNEDVSPAVVMVLSEHDDDTVRKLLANRSDLTGEQIEVILGWESEEVLYHLAQAQGGRIYSELAQDHANRLALHALPTIRAFAAGSRYLSLDIMKRLSVDPATIVRRHLAANSALSAGVLQFLSTDRDKSVAKAALKRIEDDRKEVPPVENEANLEESSGGILKRLLRKIGV